MKSIIDFFKPKIVSAREDFNQNDTDGNLRPSDNLIQADAREIVADDNVKEVVSDTRVQQHLDNIAKQRQHNLMNTIIRGQVRNANEARNLSLKAVNYDLEHGIGDYYPGTDVVSEDIRSDVEMSIALKAQGVCNEQQTRGGYEAYRKQRDLNMS